MLPASAVKYIYLNVLSAPYKMSLTVTNPIQNCERSHSLHRETFSPDQRVAHSEPHPDSPRTHWDYTTCISLLSANTNIQTYTAGDDSVKQCPAVGVCVRKISTETERACLLINTAVRKASMSWSGNHSWAVSATLTPHTNSCQKVSERMPLCVLF